MTEFIWTDELKDATIRDELDRRHPERIKLRPTDVAGLQQAVDVVEELWAPTIERARRLPPPMLHGRVNGEYSFVETFRHLLFAWEAWLSRVVPGMPNGYHEWAVPPDLPPDAGGAVMWSINAGWSSVDAAPDLDPVLDVRAECWARVRDYLSGSTAEDLKSRVPQPWNPRDCSALYCFLVVLNDEWWHHRYATRDLSLLERK